MGVDRAVGRASARVGMVGLGTCLVAAGMGAGPTWGVANGSPAPPAEFGYVTHVHLGDNLSCTGVLVSPRWVLTATSCLGPAPSATVSSTTARRTVPDDLRVVVGRTDLRGDVFEVTPTEMPVTEVVPHADRGVSLLRLARRAPEVSPATLSPSAPLAGEDLRAAGYGRTALEWNTDVLHVGDVRVTSVAGSTFDITGTPPVEASPCRGDAGGPVVRSNGDDDSPPAVVGLLDVSWQAGCLGEQETRRGATAVRVDGLDSWVLQVTRDNPRGDVNGDGRSDLVALYGCASGASLLWRFENVAEGGLPRRSWAACDESWVWAKTKTLTGDVDGDGRSDLIAITEEKDTSVNVRILRDAASATSTWTRVWAGAADGMVWSRTKPVVGDFTGEGVDDLVILYRNAEQETRLLLFDDLVGGKTYRAMWREPRAVWDWERTKLVVGDFDGDRRSDLAAVYWDSDDSIRLRVLTAVATTGLRELSGWRNPTPSKVWERTKPVAGDFTGDGVDDVAFLHLTADGDTRLLLFDDVMGGAAFRTMWNDKDLAPAWDWTLTRLVTGDFDGDGRTDIAATHPDSTGTGSELRVMLRVATPKAPARTVWRDDKDPDGPTWLPERIRLAAVSEEAG